MAPKPEPARLAYLFGMVLAVAAIILAITTHNLAAPSSSLIYHAQLLPFVLRRSTSFCLRTTDPPACCRHQRWLCSLTPSPKARKGEPLVAAGVRPVRVLEPPAVCRRAAVAP